MSVQDVDIRADKPSEPVFKNGSRVAVVDCGECKKLQPELVQRLKALAKPFKLKLSVCMDENGHRLVKFTPLRRDVQFRQKFADVVREFCKIYKDLLTPARLAVS